MVKFNAGIRFNDLIAKYMFFEYDRSTQKCTVHIEGNDHGAVVRMKATIMPNMWEIEDDPGDGPGED